MSAVKEYYPELLKKVKIHLLLHLTSDMVDFGPTSAFNTERQAILHIKECRCTFSMTHKNKILCRCETFNSLIRGRNVYGNRLAPSRDIAKGFAVIEHLRFVCSGGCLDGSTR